MFKRIALTTLAALLCASAVSRADEEPKFKGPLSAPERSFVRSIQRDLFTRFPRAADAEKAGYVRYTDVDSTGAISYADMQWTSSDSRHPSQLWYDKRGNLLGADFSIPSTTKKRPRAFGVNPGRWYEFDEHVHYVLKDPATGKITWGRWVMAPQFVKAGGDPKHPQIATLLKLGKAKTADQVITIFNFPSVWDLIVWVKPNPSGAFAQKNPLVKR